MNMSSPSGDRASRTEPLTRPPGITSRIRLGTRRKVDLPAAGRSDERGRHDGSRGRAGPADTRRRAGIPAVRRARQHGGFPRLRSCMRRRGGGTCPSVWRPSVDTCTPSWTATRDSDQVDVLHLPTGEAGTGCANAWTPVRGTSPGITITSSAGNAGRSVAVHGQRSSRGPADGQRRRVHRHQPHRRHFRAVSAAFGAGHPPPDQRPRIDARPNPAATATPSDRRSGARRGVVQDDRDHRGEASPALTEEQRRSASGDGVPCAGVDGSVAPAPSRRWSPSARPSGRWS